VEVNKVKKINVSIRIWTSGEYAYFNNTEAVKYVWGSTTVPGDMRNQGMERIIVKGKIQYRVPIARLVSRLDELILRQERVNSAIGIIRSVLKEVEE
jgi:hypothetical protein